MITTSQANLATDSNSSNIQPHGLIDRAVIGIRGLLQFEGQRQMDKLKENFKDHLDERNNFHWEPEFFVPYESPTSYVKMCRMDVSFEKRADGQQLRNASAIHMNANKMVRKFREDYQGLPLSLDRQENFLLPSSHTQETFDDQLRLVAYVTGNAFRELCRNLPKGVTFAEGELWLKAAELNFDIECPDAVALVRRLQRVALSGATQIAADLYRVSSQNLGGHPVVRWWRQKDGIVFKAYAKTPTQVRCEVSCDDRRAIKMTVGGTCQKVSAQGAVALLRDFSTRVEGALTELVNHVRCVAANDVSPCALLQSLQPLLDLAAGRRSGPGRPAGPHAQKRAQAALDALLSDGSFQCQGDRKGEAVRSVLETLAAPEGPLKRDCRRAIYTLDPNFGGTMASISTRMARFSGVRIPVIPAVL